MTDKVFRDLFAGFCPVSGSPLSYNRGVLRARLTLPFAGGGNFTGMMYYCCWPCICDTQDFIRIDTKTVTTADGPHQYSFAVIGNPCSKPDAIPYQAPDVKCDGGELIKATLSDHGHIIIGMVFEPGVADHSDAAAQSVEPEEYAPHCKSRADAGHNSGMGMIFREVANISPIAAVSVASADSTNTVATTEPTKETTALPARDAITVTSTMTDHHVSHSTSAAPPAATSTTHAETTTMASTTIEAAATTLAATTHVESVTPTSAMLRATTVMAPITTVELANVNVGTSTKAAPAIGNSQSTTTYFVPQDTLSGVQRPNHARVSLLLAITAYSVGVAF